MDVFLQYAKAVRTLRKWNDGLSRRYRDFIESLAEIITTGRWEDDDVDYKSIAGALIENVFEPARRTLEEEGKPRKHITYEDTLQVLKRNPIPDDSLAAIGKALKREAPMETRIVALLVGVGKK